MILNRWVGVRTLLVALSIIAPCLSSKAQWVTQQIKLSPGFNPVFLQVTPADGSCEAIFGSTPAVQHVWMYNRYLQTSTFTTNPGQSPAGQDHWLTWFPSTSPKSFLSTMSAIRGGQSYLIFLATNSAPITISIKGIPAAPRVDWIPFDLVLAGFPVAETEKVTFYQFLKDCPEVSTQPGTASGIYSINPLTARETQIRNPDLTAITPGRAYWTRLGAHSDNPFPVSVVAPDENNSVQFPQDTKTSSITLVNGVSSGPVTVRLKLLDSEPAPGGKPARAGTVPVAVLVPQADGSYTPQFLSTGVEVTLAADERRQLRLGLAVNLLTPTDDASATYQALIEVTEASHGYRQLVPVVAEVPGSNFSAQKASLLGFKSTRPKAAAAPAATVSYEAQSAGLWVGSLILNAVNEPGFAQTNTPSVSQFTPTAASPLEVRTLLHVDASGTSRLLHHVYFAEVVEGTNEVVRMFSDAKSIPAGGVVKSRISAPSWPNATPSVMTGTFGDIISGTVSTPYTNKVNPFVHRYHPDHNNLAEDFTTPLAAGEEAFDIARQATFYFGSTLQNGANYSPTVPSLRFTGAAGEYARTTGITNTPTLSVQFWAFFPTNSQQSGTVALLTNSATRTQFKIAFQGNTGLLALTVQNGAGATGTSATRTAVPTGRWFNFTASYDGASANFYINGENAGGGLLPTLESGRWDAVWLGNTAAIGSPSFVGQLHDFVVRNGTLSSDVARFVMTVPGMIDPGNIQMELLGDAVTASLVNRTMAALTITTSGSAIINLEAAPATPLWTFGSAQGFYSETITGLRKQAITLTGSFKFTRVSQDAILR